MTSERGKLLGIKSKETKTVAPSINQVPTPIAHRGGMNKYQKNSMEEITSALELSVSNVEFDVQLCADRNPVVIHHSDLKRTAWC